MKVYRRLMPHARTGLLIIGVGMLAACASIGPRSPSLPPLQDPLAVAAAQAEQSRREAWLHAHADWGFQARIAISQAGKGGSGRLDWRQQAAHYTVSLSAPVTRQSWQLSANAAGARLEGLPDGPRQGEDANRLLSEATGWDIPVQTLSDWVRGLSAQGVPQFGADARLQSLTQAGWDIRYTEWAPGSGSQPAMPRRIEAQREQTRIRLIIDHWDFGTSP